VNTMVEYQSKKKSGLVAALLNLLIPGAGYMYCGNIILGLFVLLISVPLVFFAILAYPFWALVMVIDGFLCAGRYNKKLGKKIIAANA